MKQFLTRTVWWAIPTIWLPVVCYSISVSIHMGRTVPEVALMVVFGIFIWTLMEYTLHRFLFHINTRSYWLVLSLFFFSNLRRECSFSPLLQVLYSCVLKLIFCYRGNTIHYLLHGCHHKHPMDGLRLVFPPAATAILLVPVCWI